MRDFWYNKLTMSDVFGFRIRVVSFFVLVLGLLFGVKLFWLQVIHGHEYSEQADRQYITPEGAQFDRGTIFFKKKNGELVSAASLLRGFTLAINPKILTDEQAVFEKIKSIIPTVDQETFLAQAAKKADTYEEVATRITEDQAAQIKALKIPGVSLYRMSSRFSPSGTTAPHVIGFVSYKGNDLVGRYGVERSYNDVLSRTQSRLYVNFFAEVFSNITNLSSDESPVEGDVITNLEPAVQNSLQNELELTRERWKSDRTMGIVMDPKTGKIIAMASTPGFDINNYRSESSVSIFNDPLVESAFEMGSIMKPIILAIALDQGAVTAETRYMDYGSVKVGDRTIRNFDHKGRGNVNMQIVLNQSLNTGMVYIMSQMERSKFRDQFINFGFGDKTGIDLPAEIGGITTNLKSNREVEYANISFGQGIAATPIGMIRAMAALANGGKIIEPHIVDSIEYMDGSKKEIPTKEIRQVIKPETSAEITRMMINVFDNYFDGAKKLEHYSIAGKTGTAQIADRTTGGYYADRNMHTFVGYFPAYNPEFIIFLLNEYPKEGARFSSQTLVDPFLNLTKFLINYYNIPPDR